MRARVLTESQKSRAKPQRRKGARDRVSSRLQRRFGVGSFALMILLGGCKTTDTAAPLPAPCGGEGRTVSPGDLRDGLPDGDTVFLLVAGDYGVLTVDRPVRLVGMDADGRCAPALGAGGPVFAELTVTHAGAHIEGVGVRQ